MTIEKVLYTAKVRSTGSWKDIFMKHPLLRLVFVTLLAARGESTKSLGAGSCPSTSRRLGNHPDNYRQLTRRSDTFRCGPR